jgi:hypothetical protein
MEYGRSERRGNLSHHFSLARISSDHKDLADLAGIGENIEAVIEHSHEDRRLGIGMSSSSAILRS